MSARLCTSLREAAESPEAPYFYECLWGKAANWLMPAGDSYEAWRADIAQKMEAGREICYCGKPA